MRRVDPAPMLALDAVTVIWPGRKAGAPGYCAVKDVTFAVEPGEFLSLVGPTGCGKSTLLNVAAGLLPPSSGAVLVGGGRLSGINRRGGILFQAGALMRGRRARVKVGAGRLVAGALGGGARR